MNLVLELDGFLNTIKAFGGDARPLRVDPPASEKQIQGVEAEIGRSIPVELRDALLTFSSHLEFRWFLKDCIKLPDQLRDVYAGELHWGLDLTPDFVMGYQGWIESVFPNPDDPYDVVWHGKFPFQEVGNGDYLSLDTEGRVIYLSHDDGKGHGYVMADSFTDLLARWVPLGCVGAEDWQWLPFTNAMSTRIDPTSEAAGLWQELLGRE